MNHFDIFGNPVEHSTLDSFESEGDGTYSIPPQELEQAELVEDRTARQYPLFTALIVVVGGALFFQCFQLQVTRATENKSLAEGNSIRVITTQPERGLITDRNGTVLAQNSRQVALAVNPQTLPSKKSEREAVYEKLRTLANLDAQTISFIEGNRLKDPEPFAVKTKLSKEESLLYREQFFAVPGIQLTEIPIRSYQELASFSHLAGFVGGVSESDLAEGASLNQQTGKTGLERQYNQQLTGSPGKLRAEVNAQGELVRQLSDGTGSDPVTGNTLQLAIDAKLQQAVADALNRELANRTQRYGNQPTLGASVVIMDPRSGAVRAMVSLPDYSPNSFAQGISNAEYSKLLNDPGTPLLNRATQGVFTPGSTLKPLVSAAGLQEGLITANTQMDTPEAILIGDFRFPDWKFHGQTNTRKALAESNNIFFYALGGGWEERKFRGLGITKLRQYLASFGLGENTGLDLPGEVAGLLPSPEWKERVVKEPWYIGNTYQMAIGQGYLLTTPLQMANATVAIANGGTLWKPKLAEALINPTTGSRTEIAPEAIREGFTSPGNLRIVREGMRQAVESGSARLLNNLTVKAAGKTGTAQFGDKGLTHAWFTGFAPYDNPEIAFAILIEGGGESFYSSVPVAEEVLRAYFNEPLAPGQQLFSAPDARTSDAIAAEFRGER